MKIDSILPQLNEGIPSVKKKPMTPFGQQQSAQDKAPSKQDPKVLARQLAQKSSDVGANFAQGGKKLGIFKEEEVEEARDLPGNQERIDVAPPKGKITGADFKALRDKKKDQVEEETKKGRVHKGHYGRHFDTDEEGLEKKKAAMKVKKGRGRPKKDADKDFGDAPTFDFAKDLQSFMIGNLPGGKLPGKPGQKHRIKDEPETAADKPGKKHKLKDWIEHVQADMIAESAQIAEVALDPSQLAVPRVAGTGATTAATTQPGSTMGAAVIDFKNPQDPLKAALQKAVQQKQVSVLGEGDYEDFADMTDEELIKRCKREGLERSCHTDGHGTLLNREECIDLLKKHTTDDDKVDEAAPKGWEGTVKAMKKHKEIDNPWALAHYMKGKGYKSHKKESVEESVESTGQTLLEGYTFEELMGRFPHEHKMCQEGWGMDENLYEALCDHYFKEGRIPYKVWHGPLEELRKHVEKCYMEDTLKEGPAVDAYMAGKSPAIAHYARQLDDLPEGNAAPAMTHSQATAARLGDTPPMPPVTRDQMAKSTMPQWQVPTTIRKQLVTKPQADLPESALERALRQGKDDMAEGLAEDKDMDNTKLDEKYMGFKKTVAAIKKGGSAEDPEAVAAAIGRKKYGKEKFQKAAAAGKKLGESDVQMESWEAQLASMLVEGDMPPQHKQPEKVEECGDEPAGMEGNDIVKALAALLGMAPKSSPMSVAGDDGAHAIEVIPVAPGDVQDQLSHDQQSDNSGGDLDFIKRMLGARMGPDYAEERAMEGQTETASPGDSHMSPLSKVEEADLEEVSRGEWIKQQDAQAEKSGKDKFQAFGQTFDTDDVKEDAQSEEDSMALSSEANRDAALATAYAADNSTNKDTNVAVSEGEETCMECGAYMEEGHTCESLEEGDEHVHEEELNEWANSPAGHSEDEQFQTDMDFMTKVISGGLNNIKRDQTVLPSTAVATKEETTDAEFSIAEQLRKLAGIN